ncbi:exodeoxyribonuclease V subunit beta [Mycobacterium heidelbergense]|uniref:RecBCD enzyme subunit RecB n=1 Tax=Mycobacterium heidelbergense TaxID=53376 RepID=A0A1X0DPG0_MYCHE|nr:exodeoxyribonuclease V subunit beta [Mycobacterium heidelbergense]MCV7049372.1 exodeoxyribonuclease V subunit beta [Mycobacterium heidelbergense]ORA74304.1 exodeoxyribonuclease V subunit beta [Mycobacterium heidelbergense]BBZ49525.1 RecBCD enzyme subunit RecB [Mycobacterium heidelbergense]
MDRFDLLGPLPRERSTTVLEASAGTGKTFALAGLVTRYLAETDVTLDDMLLITFNRNASRELRERVRGQIVEALSALEGHAPARSDLVEHLVRGGDVAMRARLRDALANFDAATIATTHEFCGRVLKSLGVAGDTAADVRLQESLDDLVTEIVDDLYLARFGRHEDDPVLSYRQALDLARAVVNDPCAQLRPVNPDPDGEAGARLRFAGDVCAELDRRKRRLRILGYDDLLTRLAKALEAEDSPARDRMRRRWRIVLVDEFQDTDPIQWRVLERAFGGHATLILIGDPKQAIYGFRGGDIHTYLMAARSAAGRYTLGINWRSDRPLVDALQTVLKGAALGHPEIVVHDIDAHHDGQRLAGAPHNAPFRLRVVKRPTLGHGAVSGTDTIPIDKLRRYIPSDLAADVAALLAGDATYDGRPVRAGDIAVIVEQHVDARACRDALAAAGIAAVYTGDTDVFQSQAAKDWLCLLEAFDAPQRSGLVRAAACTMFFGETAETLAAEGDALTDRVAGTLRQWLDYARERGIAAVFEAAQRNGMGRRVLAQHGGERHMTDLAHIAELMYETAHRERYSPPALRDWLRRQCDNRTRAREHNRRLDSDAAAVQIMTVFVAKGLQFPIVYLPFAFNRYVRSDDILLYHEDDTRCLYIGGKNDSPERETAKRLNLLEDAQDNLRTTYVALTRAQSQVVAWWAPTKYEVSGGLSRLLRGRGVGESGVPDRCGPDITDEDAWAVFKRWEAVGGPSVEESVIATPPAGHAPEPPPDFAVRHFHRTIDTSWRRTSYSALVRGAEEVAVRVISEPEVGVRDDEVEAVVVAAPAPEHSVASPLAAMPAGAAFGSLVHAVMETADPGVPDLPAELERQVRRHRAWWPVDVDAAELAAALVPMHDTPLGPLAEGVTLRRIGVRDRLRELGFEIPLAGGDRRGPAPHVTVSDVGELLRLHLPAADPLAPYADRLMSAGLGDQSLRGYLAGSIDVVLRLPGQRYLVVDYKTNHLGDTAADYGFARLTEAMLHSDYPLQALLYTVVLHRFLRWRVSDYDPARHVGGVLYLFVRGMCGADTPVHDGHPAGVFGWNPPPELVVALSDLLDAGRRAA